MPAKRTAKQELKEYFSAQTTQPYAHVFRYGRSALYYLLKALGFEGKEIILPAYTCVVVANAVIASGNIPVFVDNAPGSLQPGYEEYLAAVNERTGMVIVTHLFGLPAEVKGLYQEVKRRHPEVWILADCAHAFFCRFEDGSSVFAEADGALFGMNISKLLNSVYGGVLTLNDHNLSHRIAALCLKSLCKPPRFSLLARAYVVAAAFGFTRLGYGLIKWMTPFVPYLKRQVDYYSEDRAELPSDYDIEMSDFEAGIGLDSTNKYAARIRGRQALAEKYLQLLKASRIADRLELPNHHPGCTWSHFPMLVPAFLRDDLIARFAERHRIELGKIVDYSICDFAYYAPYRGEGCPGASAAAASIINLPLTLYEGLCPSPKGSAEALVAALVLEFEGLEKSAR